jgi:hypothetical protein
MIGSSPPMKEVFKILRKVSPTDLSVLVLGETGTGKELIAKELHRLSARSGKPFVSINCGAIPENLLESELFGYKRGAFTGANTDKVKRDTQLMRPWSSRMSICQTCVLRPMCTGLAMPLTQPSATPRMWLALMSKPTMR